MDPLNNAPKVLDTTAELSTGDRGRERVSRDTNLLVNVRICKVILAVSHGADRDTDRVLLRDRGQVLSQGNNRGVVREG